MQKGVLKGKLSQTQIDKLIRIIEESEFFSPEGIKKGKTVTPPENYYSLSYCKDGEIKTRKTWPSLVSIPNRGERLTHSIVNFFQTEQEAGQIKME